MSDPIFPASVVQTTNDPSVSRPDRRKVRTRKAFLLALETLAGTRPLDELTIGVLAEAADVNRVTFYAHYRTLDEVIDEAVLGAFAQAAATLEAPFVDPLAFPAASENLSRFLAAFTAHQNLFHWIGSSSRRHRIPELFFLGARRLLEDRITPLDTTCPRSRRELFLDYTAAGMARVAARFALEHPTEAERASALELLPILWVPAAYTVLGIPAP